MAQHSLIVPLLSDDPIYAFGVEFGLLYSEMRLEEQAHGDRAEVSGYFTVENQDQILLAASRLGWSVREMERSVKGWFWLVMGKGK